MLIMGVTGGIGSGKTAATDWFAAQGIDIIDADVLARQVVAKGSQTLQKIKQAFGDWTMTPAGELNRGALREHIFTHPQSRTQLESITHPAINELVQSKLSKATSPYVIVSAPLLLEGGSEGLLKYCDLVLVVDAPEELQLMRASKRDDNKRAQIQRIMDAQMARQERLKLADDIVKNHKDMAHLHEQLEVLHKKYLNLASKAV